jgi:predicted phage tail protein
LYKNKLGLMKADIEENRDRYISGVKLLEDIQNTVTQLNEVLVVKKIEVEEKKSNAEQIEAIVKVEKDKVEKESASAQITLDKASNLKEFIANKKGDIEGKIAVAMPKVAETLEKLELLDRKQVEFIKSLASPDEKIKQTI